MPFGPILFRIILLEVGPALLLQLATVQRFEMAAALMVKLHSLIMCWRPGRLYALLSLVLEE